MRNYYSKYTIELEKYRRKIYLFHMRKKVKCKRFMYKYSYAYR